MLKGKGSVLVRKGLYSDYVIPIWELAVGRGGLLAPPPPLKAPIHFQSQSELVGWFFKPSQPQGIISGLKETFMKRYIVERTNKAETRPEELSEKAESCRENLWNEIQLKGP